MRIGLISDTHLVRGKLPKAVENAFREVDRILHAGDLVTLDVLHVLEDIAPVTAVQGNMDMPDVCFSLPLKTVFEVEGHRIGLIHGHHVPHPSRVLRPPADLGAMHSYLLNEFRNDSVDCIAYGHTHRSCVEMCHSVHIVNAGSATRASNGRCTVGLLTVRAGQISTEIVDLS